MKKLIKTILTLALILIIAVVAAVVYSTTNGFKDEAKTFSIERDEKYILSDQSNIKIYGEETFKIKHYGDDERISAKITPIAIENDYSFSVSHIEYSWNAIAESKPNWTKYFTVELDQTANTVRIAGTQSSVLTAYAAHEGGELTAMDSMVYSNMYRLDITTGGSTIGLKFCVLSA